MDHWIIETELNLHGKRTTRNYKMCLKMGKKDAKAVNMCSKCTVPLHPKCFCAYHVPNAPRPN